MKRSYRKNMALLVLALVWWPLSDCPAKDYAAGLSEKTPMIIDKAAREVRLLATVQRKAFQAGWFKQLPGHHAVTWRQGRKGHEALFATFASDAEVYNALIALGAVPGDNLTQAVWDERNNPRSSAPDTRVQGTPVDAFVWWLGLDAPLPLASVLNDPSGKGIDLRFGGQKDLIPVWKSGCIICLQSCPGGKISNRQYTIRDYVQDRATFTVNKAIVPEEEKRVVVIIRLREPEAEPKPSSAP